MKILSEKNFAVRFGRKFPRTLLTAVTCSLLIAGVPATVFANTGTGTEISGTETADPENNGIDPDAEDVTGNDPAGEQDEEPPAEEQTVGSSEAPDRDPNPFARLFTVSVADCGADGSDEEDDTAGIQAAIDSVRDHGGTVYIPNGTYYLSSPLDLPSFVTLRGETRDGVILTADSAMDSMIRTGSYDSLMQAQTSKWNDTTGVPMAYALCGMTIDGKNLSENGLSMYGYDFRLQDLLIRNQTGNGIAENWGRGDSDPWNDNYSKFFESYIDGVEICDCGTGIIWSDLTDAFLTGLTVYNCTTGLEINAPVYIDTAVLRNNGTGIVLNADAQASYLTVSKCDTGVRITGWQADIDFIRAENNKRTDIEITRDSRNAVIRSAEIKTSDGHDPVINDGNAVIGKLTVNKKTTCGDMVSTSARLDESKYFKKLINGLDLAAVDNGQSVADASSFGAEGNLSHDDTVALQQAIDSLKETGGTVRLGPGKYRITKTLNLYSGITLAGDGTHATVIFLGDNSNCTMLEAGDDARNYAIRDIEFNGNKWNGHNSDSTGLMLGGSEFLIDNVWVNGASGNGVSINAQASGPYSLIRNLNIKYCGGKGIVYGTSGNVYSNALTVSECGDTALETNAPALFGFVHLYANHGTYQMVENGGAKGEKIVSESSYGMALMCKKKSARFGTLQCYNNRGTDVYVRPAAKNVLFGTVMLKNSAAERSAYADLSGSAKYGLKVSVRDSGYSQKTMEISGIAETYEYTGKAVKPAVSISYKGKNLKNGTHYTISYVNNTDIGNAAAVIVSKGVNRGAFVIPFKITEPKVKDLSGTYFIVSANNRNLAVDISGGSKASGANVWLYTLNRTDAQKFIFSKTADGYYTVLNAGSGKSLDIYGGSPASGTNVWQYNANGSDAQKWEIIDNPDGAVIIKSKLGTVLDIYNGNIRSGTNIWAYKGNGSMAQKWILIPA